MFVADNCNTGNPHFGSKLAFGRDGMLYMTVGERGDRNRAQNTNIHGGKVLRLTEDGTAPPDNPFVGKPGYKPEIFSYGHRNPQGLAFHPETGVLWETEHGPQGGDEVNIVQPGKNYGWPVASYGREYAPERREDQHGGIEGGDRGADDALAALNRHLGTDLLHRRQVPHWKGHMFTGGMSGWRCAAFAFNAKGGLMGREAMLDSAAPADPRRASGPGRLHLSGRGREPRPAFCGSSRSSPRAARPPAGDRAGRNGQVSKNRAGLRPARS